MSGNIIEQLREIREILEILAARTKELADQLKVLDCRTGGNSYSPGVTLASTIDRRRFPA